MADIAALAERYYKDVHAVDAAAVPGEPEAQLTTPVSNLFTALVEHIGVGRLRLIRESRLGGSRPDFAALHERASKTHQIGYIELKAPDIVADPASWAGRNATQWQKMSAEAEILMLCTGALHACTRMAKLLVMQPFFLLRTPMHGMRSRC